MAKVTLITGGARSGKSAFALQTAIVRTSANRAFLATAQACDEEMAARIKAHRDERGPHFDTIEEPLALQKTLRKALSQYDIVLVDCLTVWLGNLIHFHKNDYGAVDNKAEGLVDFIADAISSQNGDCVLVTNEVGWGIVPENAMARAFRDIAGRLNSRIGALAHEVVLVACGIPTFLKGRKGNEHSI
jgi:adenosylcobinamide kinase / adenosylcobinamide-phosphate guanylyltransferase